MISNFHKYLLTVVTFMIIALKAGTGQLLSDEECQAAGFVRPQCSSCDQLEAFELNEIEDLCQQCCVEDNQSTNKRYPKAQLEVCRCMFPSLPQIEAFVQKEAPYIPNLTIKHVNGQSPIIKLIEKDGSVDRVLSITKWTTDTITEFFRSHLE